MSKPLVPDELWAAILPLLPLDPPRPKGGRPCVPDRAALTGILFVLATGSPWGRLPVEMGCGSGMTCWRRLRDRQAAGVWAQLHRVLLDRLEAAGCIRWDRAALDSSTVPAKRMARPVGKWHLGRWPEQSAKTYPASERMALGQDGDPRALVLTRGPASKAILCQRVPERRSTVGPSTFPATRRHRETGAEAADQFILALSGLRCCHGVAGPTMVQQRPDDPCHLGCERHHGGVGVRPSQQGA